MTNKEKVERWPFIAVRDYNDEIFIDDRTGEPEVWELPTGWEVAFADMMWDEIKAELEKFDYVDKFRIVEVKEKFAQLRVYYDDAPDGCKVDDIIDKYSVLSKNICELCGRPDTAVINKGGWIFPICEDCLEPKPPFEYEDFTTLGERRMSDYMYYSVRTPDGDWKDEKMYIGNTAEKIRERWHDRH